MYLSGIPFLVREILQKNKVTILCFHEMKPEVADRCFNYFTRKYNIIPFKSFLLLYEKAEMHKLPPKALIITFDDGRKSNYSLYPIFKKYNIPATIFLCSGIVGTNKGFWWNHNHTSYSNEELKKMSDNIQNDLLLKTGFYVDKELKCREALSKEEIIEMMQLCDFQSHTMSHPILTKCTDDKCWDEIMGSKKDLEHRFGMNIYGFAFPNGDYGNREINFVERAGYRCSFTTEHGFVSSSTNRYKLNRISGGTGTSYFETIVKASGCWGFIKNILL
jgi:peptidoglycan/xylan/chitin deacetylase (PgdA/CDA1 family)